MRMAFYDTPIWSIQQTFFFVVEQPDCRGPSYDEFVNCSDMDSSYDSQ